MANVKSNESKETNKETVHMFKVIEEKYMPEEFEGGIKVKLRGVIGADGVVCNRINMSNYRYGLLTGVLYDSVTPSELYTPTVKRVLIPALRNSFTENYCEKYAKTGELVIWVTPCRDFDATKVDDKTFIASVVLSVTPSIKNAFEKHNGK